MARAQWRAGLLDEAEVNCRLAVSEWPSDAWAHNYLGNILSVKHNLLEAVRYLKLATDLEPRVGFFWGFAVAFLLTSMTPTFIRATDCP